MDNNGYLAEEGGRHIQPQRPREDLSCRGSSVPVAPTQIRQRPLPAGQHALDESPNPDTQESNKPLLPTMVENTRSVPRRVPHPRPGTAFERCGVLAMTILIVGTIVILASLAFLTFLWFASTNNITWHRIAMTNWMTRAVSLSALFLRTAISAQASVLTSMLAAVALEGRQVLAIQVASISSMRNANGGPFWLTYQSLLAFSKLAKRTTQMYLPITLSVLLLSTSLIQFSSTALLADLQLHPLPGDTFQSLQQTNFIYDPTQWALGESPLKQINRAPTWTLHPAIFPTFAEHSEAPLHSRDGVSDTGLALRAFLPLQDQQSRYSIRNYTGRATVVDSSVVCMRPKLSSTALYQSNSIVFVSQIQPSSNISSIIMSPVLDGYVVDELYASPKVPYSSCAISPSVLSSGWGLSFCQIQGSGSLRSAFTNTSANVTGGGIFGATYLALNFTSGTADEWGQYMGGDAFAQGVGHGGFKPPLFADNGEWLDLLFTSNGSLQLSVSLCYAAWDSADLVIEASSNQNRTEPVAIFDRENTNWRYDNIRRQLGQSARGPWIQGMVKDRGLLELAKRQSWMPSDADYARPNWRYRNKSEPFMSFLLDAAKLEKASGNLDTASLTNALAANYSVVATGDSTTTSLCNGSACIMPDPSMTGIIQEILQNGGDIAHALQSFITVSSGLTYYDQLPQFNGDSSTSQTMLVFVLMPVRHRGFVAVVVVSFVHLVLTAVIGGLFFAGTDISTVGNAWQGLAQVKDFKTENILDHVTLMSDKGVKSWMKKDGSSSGEKTLAWDDIVGIEQSESGDRTQIVCERRRDMERP